MLGRSTAFDAAIQGLLLFLLFATPLALGGVLVPFASALEWLSLVLVLLWILRAVWVSPAAAYAPGGAAAPRSSWSLFGHPLLRTRLEIPIALFLGLVLLQLLPMPRGLLGRISPSTAQLYEQSLPGYAEGRVDFARAGSFLLGPGHDDVAARILSAPGDLPVDLSSTGSILRTLSIYPNATVNRLLLLLALLGIFVVVVHGVRTAARLEWMLRAIVLYGFAMAVFGIIQRLAWNGKIYWLVPVTSEASPFGTFVNHNHFAAFLAMIVPVAAGMLLDETRRLSRAPAAGGMADAPEAHDGRSASRPGLFALHGPDPFARLFLAAFVVGVMAAAVALSASRGASIALAGALLLYGGALIVQGRVGRAEMMVAAALLILAFGLSLWLGLGPLAKKIHAIGDVDTEPSLRSRVVGWQWTLKIVGDHPLFGTGLGTFGEAWAQYYPPGTSGVWHEAHNDYLQILSETGAVGLVIVGAGVLLFAWRYLLPGLLYAQRRSLYAVHGIAVGILAAAIHSIVDFPLQINACAVLFVVMSGLLVAHRLREEGVA